MDCRLCLALSCLIVYGVQATTGLTITAAQPRSPTVPLTSDNVIDGAFETKAEYIFTTPFFPEVRIIANHSLTRTSDLTILHYRFGRRTLDESNS